jgi:hypothetical protein
MDVSKVVANVGAGVAGMVVVGLAATVGVAAVALSRGVREFSITSSDHPGVIPGVLALGALVGVNYPRYAIGGAFVLTGTMVLAGVKFTCGNLTVA